MGYDVRRTVKKSLLVGIIAGASACVPYLLPLVPPGPWTPLLVGAAALLVKFGQDYLAHKDDAARVGRP